LTSGHSRISALSGIQRPKKKSKKVEVKFLTSTTVLAKTISHNPRGVQKHHKKVLAESSCQKVFAKKIEEKSCCFFSIDFLSRFGPFLGSRASKTPPKASKIRPKNLRKKSQ
jgi:hypothetical protein